MLRCGPDESAAPSCGSAGDEPARARRAAERLIERRYARRYGAHITSHYPTLISVHAADGSAVAAAGYRSAADETLYLEAYLDRPIEDELGRALCRPVERSEIVEIGNLASCSRSASIKLFDRLARSLHDSAFRYAVATMTTELRRVLEDLGVSVLDLGAASPDRLPDNGRAWGSYYDTRPRIVAGRMQRDAGPVFASAGDAASCKSIPR